MQACYQEILPANGVDHALSLSLTPSSLPSTSSTSSSSSSTTSRALVLSNLVTARNNWLRIYEVREEDISLPTTSPYSTEHERERRKSIGVGGNGSGTRSRRGTEAVAGEVEMDPQGEGFVNVDVVKNAPTHPHRPPRKTTLRLLREHRLHGVVTGLGKIHTLTSNEDGLERLVVSFREAKIAVLEWSDITHDISTVSIHSYERAPQVMTPSPLHAPLLRLDPSNRCAALLLPHDAFAILPFNQSQSELEGIGLGIGIDDMEDEEILVSPSGETDLMRGEGVAKDIPYSPSYILDLCMVDERVRNVVDYCFLPGYSTPTMAILFQEKVTWTGRLKEHLDTTSLLIITLSTLTPPHPSNPQSFPIISSVSSLPYDAFSLTPCPPSLGLGGSAGGAGGGLVVLCSNSVVYVEGGRKVVLPVSGWAARCGGDVPIFELDPKEETDKPADADSGGQGDSDGNESKGSQRVDANEEDQDPEKRLISTFDRKTLKLEGSIVVFPTPSSVLTQPNPNPEALLITSEGYIHTLTFTLSGHSVSKMELDIRRPLGRGTIPSCVEVLPGRLRVKKEGFKGGDGEVRSGNSNERGDAEEEGDEGCRLFVGSAVGSSLVLKVSAVSIPVPGSSIQTGAAANGVEVKEEDNAAQAQSIAALDLDDDIYGDSLPGLPSTLASTNLPKNSAALISSGDTIRKTTLTLLDSVPAYGPIADMHFMLANNGEKYAPELVAATGSGHMGGLTFFQQYLPMRTKRKLHALGGSRGIWEIPLREPPRHSAGPSAQGGPHPGCNAVVLSTDATPAPGLSRVAARPRNGDVLIMSRYNGTTVGAGPFFQGTAILQATTNSVRLLGPDGVEKQTIKDVERDTGASRARIRSCSVADPYVLIIREDKSIGLFIGDKGGVRRKDMTPLGAKTSKYSSGGFFTDESNTLRSMFNPSSSKSKTLSATTSLEAVTDPDRGTQWLMLCRANGVLEIWTLPKLALAFTTNTLTEAPSVCVDSFALPITQTEDTSSLPEERTIGDVVVSPIGEAKDRQYLTVLFKGGQLNIYELIKVPKYPAFPTNREQALPIQLFKHSTYNLPDAPPQPSAPIASATPGRKSALRHLQPFSYKTRGVDESFTHYDGVFLLGDHPLWILGSELGGIRIHKCQHNNVYAFTPTTMWNNPSEPQPNFLMHTDSGPILTEWVEDYSTEGALPTRSMKQGKAYSHIRYNSSLNLLLAAAAHPSKYKLFDEEGNAMWEPEAPEVPEPYQLSSALEIISPYDGFIIDGYEFGWNEFVNSMEVVTLESLSTEEGEKEFIACGTTISRGEDLAVKGATYIFDIVEVVSSPPDDEIVEDDDKTETGEVNCSTTPTWDNVQPGRHFRLKLLCKDECKGAVTAVCSINGYLVSSMGQKIFVRAFELDERLVGVAFLDVGVYVTCLVSLKNLLLIGDVDRSVQFVAFQEDPFKLVIISRDTRHQSVVSANFVYSNGEMAIVTRDREGVIRMWGYEPFDPDTAGGQDLLLKSEFNAQSYAWCAIPAIERSYPAPNPGEAEVGLNVNATMMDDGDPQLKVLWGCTDGSVTALIPIGTQPVMDMDMDVEMAASAVMGLDPTTGMNMDVNMMGPVGEFIADPTGAANLGVPMPVDEEAQGAFAPSPGGEISKRLHLLQGRLVRGVLQVAGLNPRTFRALLTPTSTSSARPASSKSTLDCVLLQSFHDLPFDRQYEMCKEIGSTREEVLQDLALFDPRRGW